MSHLGPLQVFSISVPSPNILGPNISHRGHCPEIVDINFPSPILMRQSKRIVPLTLQYFGHLTRNTIQREPYGPVAPVGIRFPESSGVVRSCPESFGVVRSRSVSSGIVRSRSEPSGFIRSHLESSGVFWSRSESFGVVQSRLKSFRIGVGRSQQEPCG